ncbi:hypothetical protein PG995_003264 [Apiospora arundinis]
MSAAFPRVARQVASRRLFSTQMPLRQGHASLGQELQGIFRPSMGVKSQKGRLGKDVCQARANLWNAQARVTRICWNLGDLERSASQKQKRAQSAGKRVRASCSSAVRQCSTPSLSSPIIWKSVPLPLLSCLPALAACVRLHSHTWAARRKRVKTCTGTHQAIIPTNRRNWIQPPDPPSSAIKSINPPVSAVF